MAAIDKMYGSQKDWQDLYDFLESKKKKWWSKKYMYPKPTTHEGKDHPIANFPKDADKWLLENCPVEFVQKRLREQYPKYYAGAL